MKLLLLFLLVCLCIAKRTEILEEDLIEEEEQQVDYVALANGLLQSTNFARKNPLAVADTLSKQIPYFDGTNLFLPGKEVGKITKEGVFVWNEAINFLNKQAPMYPMKWDPKLVQAAKDHVLDLAANSMTGHIGSSGSTPSQRIQKYGNINTTASENIACGSDVPDDVVNQLIVDDDFPTRGHRYTVYSNTIFLMGAYCGYHPKLRLCCVIDYVDGWYTDPS
jgi:uncharacterized protein YkwD